MTREMIIEQLERHRTEFALDHGWNTRVLESLDAAIKLLKQEPCEDTISRQAVLDIDFKRIILTTAKPAETIEQKVKALPSVQPEVKMGRWIGHREHCENLGVMPSGLGAYEWCSNCDCGIDVREWHRNHYNYCPNCGAKMQEVEE